jgi:hypothetical protein
MKTIRCGLLGLLTAGSLLSVADGRAVAQDEVKAILDRAIQALGGEAKLTQLAASRLKAKGTLQIQGGVSFAQEVFTQLPAQIRETVELDQNGQKVTIITLLNGEQGALTVNGTNQEVTKPLLTELKEAAHLLRVCRLLPLKDGTSKLSLLAEVHVNGRPALCVRVESPGYRSLKLFFDKETALLVEVERTVVDPPTGKEMNEERFLAEYRDADGLRSPRKTTIYRDGKKYLEAEVTEVRFLERLDAMIFTRP